MIYSVLQQKEVPVTVTKETNFVGFFAPDETVYTVHDASEPETGQVHQGPGGYPPKGYGKERQGQDDGSGRKVPGQRS